MRTAKRGNVVGISANFHDAACSILRDGTLIAAAQEERFSRIKHDPSMPKAAFRYCLAEAGLDITDIDCIAFYEQPQKKLARQLWMGLPGGPAKASAVQLDATRHAREIREILGYEGPIEYVDHHLAHAASSFFFSGFDESAVLTVDGVGEWATTTYGRGEGSKIDLFEEVQFPDSLGLLYSTITGYLGFEVNDGEYKVMGLAPYGKPIFVDQVGAMVRSGPNGSYALDLSYFDFLRGDHMYSEKICDLFGLPPRERESEILQVHKDIARSLQVVLEQILLEKARYLHSKVPSDHLCMAGGVALNCVANGRILRDGPFKDLYVQPASDDSGGSIGAAAIAYTRMTGERVKSRSMGSACLGPSYSSSEVEQLLGATSIAAKDFRGNERGLIDAVAERLAAGKIVGWFHGRMEFGPRALGSRSIIADPRGPEMRDRINALVKMRESFRPFAPAVLAEKAGEHFKLDCPSPYMLLVCPVTSSLDLPAITHVDGSARVQTVHEETSPRFTGLLREFERRTGCPMVLNTSFNVRGEPIVCTPLDALICFVIARLDCLVLEDFVIDRADITPRLAEVIPGLRRRTDGRGVGSKVYTLW